MPLSGAGFWWDKNTAVFEPDIKWNENKSVPSAEELHRIGIPYACSPDNMSVFFMDLSTAMHIPDEELNEKEYEPELADFVYIFDTPSSDIHAMGHLAALADGIAVWGGETAVKATRAFAPVGTKLIEWGHKLGFCYISGNEDITEELYGLAEHIATTKQLLCSSCQTIFIDTEDEKELKKFCEQFLPLLNDAVSNHSDNSIGIRARRTILSRP